MGCLAGPEARSEAHYAPYQRKPPWSWRPQESGGYWVAERSKGGTCASTRAKPAAGAHRPVRSARQSRGARVRALGQEGIELTLQLERLDIAEAACRLPVDEDLGHRPLPGGRDQPTAEI